MRVNPAVESLLILLGLDETQKSIDRRRQPSRLVRRGKGGRYYGGGGSKAYDGPRDPQHMRPAITPARLADFREASVRRKAEAESVALSARLRIERRSGVRNRISKRLSALREDLT